MPPAVPPDAARLVFEDHFDAPTLDPEVWVPHYLLPIDIAEFHTYAVEWTPERVEFLVDGEPVRGCAQSPDYPMQMMIAVFDFPDRSTGDDSDAVPELIVDYLRGYER